MRFSERYDPVYDPDDLEMIQAKDGAYRKRLKKFMRESWRIDPTLYRYFSHDFFHDGEMRNLQIGSDFKSLSLEMECPNIQRISPPMDLSMWYKVEFTEIAFMALEYEPVEEGEAFTKAMNPVRLEYYYAELQSLNEKIDEANRNWMKLKPKEAVGFNSIIIYTQPQLLTISFVFRHVDCEPLEPLALELMENNPNYRMPVDWAKLDDDDAGHTV